jgi:hypothetical protein
MPRNRSVKARFRKLLASAAWQMGHRRAQLDSTPGNVHPIDRGNSRGVLLADIKPVVDEEEMAS